MPRARAFSNNLWRAPGGVRSPYFGAATVTGTLTSPLP